MNADAVSRAARLRDLAAARRGVLVPGVANALAARIVADLGFEALYLSGAGVTNTWLGMPDVGLIGLPELAQHTAAVRDVTELPLMVDADTGFGNAINVRHTVRTLERAGADAIQLEDQVQPKRCGHFSGKDVIGLREAADKIKAAADARRGELLIVARTDARATLGYEAAIERGQAFIEAGADILFVEAPESREELAGLPRRLVAPQLVNMVIGGRTPVLGREELAEMGFGLVLYANAALQGAMLGMQRALRSLQGQGRLDEDETLVVPFVERQRLVGKPEFDLLERVYSRN